MKLKRNFRVWEWIKKGSAILLGSIVTLVAALFSSYVLNWPWAVLWLLTMASAEYVVHSRPNKGSIEDAMVKASVVVGLLGAVVGLTARYVFLVKLW